MVGKLIGKDLAVEKSPTPRSSNSPSQKPAAEKLQSISAKTLAAKELNPSDRSLATIESDSLVGKLIENDLAVEKSPTPRSSKPQSHIPAAEEFVESYQATKEPPKVKEQISPQHLDSIFGSDTDEEEQISEKQAVKKVSFKRIDLEDSDDEDSNSFSNQTAMVIHGKNLPDIPTGICTLIYGFFTIVHNVKL